jgi:hypothetical protein
MWTVTGNKQRARVYDITSQGHERLAVDEKRWMAVNAAVLRALKNASRSNRHVLALA